MPPLAGSSWLAEFDAVASVSRAHLDNHTRYQDTTALVHKATGSQHAPHASRQAAAQCI